MNFIRSVYSNYEVPILLGIWFVINIIISIYNKAVFQFFKFDFPFLTASIHLSVTFIGTVSCQALHLLPPSTELKWDKDYFQLLQFSVIYAANIWLATLSALIASVPLNQIIRALVPIYTIVTNFIVFGERVERKLFLPISVVIAGCAATVTGDLDVTIVALIILNISCFTSAVKGIQSQRLQMGDGVKLGATDILRYMCPPVVTMLMMGALISGEIQDVMLNSQKYSDKTLLGVLIGAGLLAFTMNIVSLRAVAVSSPLTMNVVGNVKQATTSFIAIPLFGTEPTFLLILGVIVACAGSWWYGDMVKRRPVTPDETSIINDENVDDPRHFEEQMKEVPIEEVKRYKE